MRQGHRNYSVFSYRPMQASGGTVSDILVDGRPYRVHKFTTTGTSTFDVHNAGTELGTVEYLIVGGGGGGGAGWQGGGGGAGGLLFGATALSSGQKSVVVGAGGSGGLNTVGPQNGGNSSAFGIVAIGGGRGATEQNIIGGPYGTSVADAAVGGSGGGSSHGSTGTANSVSGTSGQGNSGGAGHSSSGNYVGGGGGGAGGVGAAATASKGGNGGAGMASSITGTSTVYAAGGGGSRRSTTASEQGVGGSGIGGNATANGTGGNATANTGSGGGAGSSTGGTSAGGNGSSGVVIVRYPIGPVVPAEGISASGGNVADITVNGLNYRTHTFNSSGLFVVSGTGNLGGQIEYLSVAGGGGGSAGGGGAGGLLASSFSAENGLYSINVGTGGAQGGYDQRGANGLNSSILATKSYDTKVYGSSHNRGYVTRLYLDIYYAGETSSSIIYNVVYSYTLSATNTGFTSYTLNGSVQIGGSTVWSASSNTQYSIQLNSTITVATGNQYVSLIKGQQTGFPVYATLSAAGSYGFDASPISNSPIIITNHAVSIGGGGGGHYWGNDPNGGCVGANGGSGGGGGMNMNFSAPGGTGVSGQGYAGGSADYTGNAKDFGGGGGGGAGGVGSSYAAGSSGGPGIASSITGTSKYYAAGGGPSSQTISNTGHGGAPDQAGSSGVVVLRYRIP